MQAQAADWMLNTEHAVKTRFERFAADHPREYASLFANLDKIMGLLKSGNKVGGFNVNFFRSEGGGVYRIGQTGVPSAKESRLYLYPDNDTRVMYIIDIGTKDAQQEDINKAKEAVERIRKLAAK